jgi:hypothetical protein
MVARALLLLAILASAPPAHALSKAKQCQQACGGRIAACAGTCDTFGDMDRACRKAVLARCRKVGVGFCAAQPAVASDPAPAARAQ